MYHKTSLKINSEGGGCILDHECIGFSPGFLGFHVLEDKIMAGKLMAHTEREKDNGPPITFKTHSQ